VAQNHHFQRRRRPPMEKRPFVQPTLTEEASLAEVTLASGNLS
jgi:hypothetical protein